MKLILLLVALLQLNGTIRAQPAVPSDCGGTACTATQRCCSVTVANTCAECCLDDHCPSAPMTRCSASQTCVQCTEDSHCSGSTSQCNVTAGACQSECDSGCGANEQCDGGFCVCIADGDSCNGPNEVCDATGCVCDSGFVRSEDDGSCVPDCDPACGTGMICSRAQQCVCAPGFIGDGQGGCSSCTADCDPSCPAGEVCANSECICEPGRVRDNTTELCEVCTIECVTSGDCNNEGEVCNADNRCECPSGEKLYSGRCVGRGKLGGECLSGRCFGRRVRCNTSLKMCMCYGSCDAQTVCLRNSGPTKSRKKGSW